MTKRFDLNDEAFPFRLMGAKSTIFLEQFVVLRLDLLLVDYQYYTL